MSKVIKLFILIFGCIGQLFAQYIPYQEKYWVVTDSMQFEFNTSGLPIITTSPFQSAKRSGASYLDSITGFFSYTNGMNIWDATNQIMSGCNYPSLALTGYYSFYISNNNNPDYLYLLSFYPQWIGNPFIMYTIDKTQNNNLGSIIAVDTFADELQNSIFTNDTCIIGTRIIKHGDGKHWWVLSHITYPPTMVANTTGSAWIRWMVHNDTVTGPFFQDIGENYGHDLIYSGFTASESGLKIAVATYTKKIEIFDFDRCTGLLSNNIVIDSGRTLSINSNTIEQLDSGYISCAFSPSGKYLFVNSPDTIWQYDMEAEHIALSGNIIWYDTLDIDSLFLGTMELGPDGRIYVGTTYRDTSLAVWGSEHTQYNTWIGVVLKPDSAGLLCDFKRNGLYLDGHFNRGMIPFRYNTQLGVWVGSPCDPNTTGEANDKDQNAKLKVYPNPTNDKFNISWPVQGGYTWVLKSLAGSSLSSGSQQTGNATISTATLPEGMYFLEVHSAKEQKVEKVIIVR